MKYIFEEIISTENILMIIEEHFEDASEKLYMRNLVQDIVHHKLMDLVLDELAHEQKLLFLQAVPNEDAHQEMLLSLREWIENFEEKLHNKTKESENEMLLLINCPQQLA